MWSNSNRWRWKQRGNTPRCFSLNGDVDSPTAFPIRRKVSVVVVSILFALLLLGKPHTVSADTGSHAWDGIPPGRTEKPVKLVIPALKLDADVREVGIDQTGAMEMPQDWQEVGWYRGSAHMGEWGTAVMSGHVDHYTGPAVFYHLKRLQAGDVVVIEDRHGTRWQYRVVSKEIKPLDKWQAREVFVAQSPFPSLHLFSCVGAYSKSAQTYLERILVRCELEEIVPAPAKVSGANVYTYVKIGV